MASDAPEPENDHDRRTLEYSELLRLTVADKSDRAGVISVAAHVEIYLERILRAFLLSDKAVDEMFEGPYAPFGSLSGKIKAARVMGLITTDEALRADAIRKVRNVFAHELSASFDHPNVKKLCAKQPIAGGRMVDRDEFFHMAMNTAIQLMYRDIGVEAHLKRTELSSGDRDRLDGHSNQ